MLDFTLSAYLVLLAVYKIAEAAVTRGRWFRKVPKAEWTVFLIAVPYVLCIISPAWERLRFGIRPGYFSIVPGAIFFIAAAAVRTKSHLDLKEGFSLFIEKREGQGLVQTGLYRHVRHPLYLANLLLFVACPLFLASRISWVFTLLGLAGIIARIRIEEKFLLKNMTGYKEYMRKTTRMLIPGIF